MIVVVASVAAAATAGDTGDADYRGRRLVEVLRELQARGLDLLYSSAVVGDHVTVAAEPTATEPRALLDELLTPLGLRAQPGPGGTVLIVPAERPTATLTLSGWVVSAGRRAPIGGAEVRVDGTDRRAVSRRDGRFGVDGLAAGTYQVTVVASGFLPATFRRVDLIEDRPDVRAALESAASGVDGPERAFERAELGRLVHVALDQLPPHYGHALTWKYLDGLSVKEIASRLELSPKAAESLLTRARLAFRDGFAALTPETGGASVRPLESR